MFISYVNDLVRASKVVKFYLRADNTSATVTSTNLASAIDTFNVEHRVVVELFEYNHLILKAAKINFVVFHG